MIRLPMGHVQLFILHWMSQPEQYRRALTCADIGWECGGEILHKPEIQCRKSASRWAWRRVRSLHLRGHVRLALPQHLSRYRKYRVKDPSRWLDLIIHNDLRII